MTARTSIASCELRTSDRSQIDSLRKYMLSSWIRDTVSPVIVQGAYVRGTRVSYVWKRKTQTET